MDDGYFLYCSGNKELESGNIKEAISNFLKSLEYSAHFKTYEKLYECYTKLEEHELAKYFIRIAYECNTKNDKVSYLYSEVLINNGCIHKAKQILSDILLRNPDYKKARDALKLM